MLRKKPGMADRDDHERAVEHGVGLDGGEHPGRDRDQDRKDQGVERE
jgi:hypothetical protein